MQSTRLPGKVLMTLAGEPMLARVVTRTGRASSVESVVVATTTLRADDIIVDLARQRGWAYFRGSEDDVLDRYYQAAVEAKADVVVRITSDCPLIDPSVIDIGVRELVVNAPLDYVSNSLPPRTFPRGLDVEVIAFDALSAAWREDVRPEWREHVTPFIYRHPMRFNVRRLGAATDHSRLRWTVDTAADLAFVRRVYGETGHDRFSTADVLDLLARNPEWSAINRDVEQREVPA